MLFIVLAELNSCKEISEKVIQINVEPDDTVDGTEPRMKENTTVYRDLTNTFTSVRVTLTVRYTDGYPEELPDLSLEAIEGELEDEELGSVLHELRAVVRRSVIRADLTFDSGFCAVTG